MRDIAKVHRAGDADIVVVSVSGEIDMSNAAEVAGEIVRGVSNEALGLVLDLTDVTYLDSAGIRMLVDISRRLGWRAQGFRLVAPEGSRSQQVLSIASMETILPHVETVERATASLLVVDGSSSSPNGFDA